MAKQVKLAGDKRLSVINCVMGWGLSAAELSVLAELCAYGSMNINLAGDQAKGASKALNIPINSLNVHLTRIATKGAIRKHGRIIVLHPSLTDIDKLDALTVKFEG